MAPPGMHIVRNGTLRAAVGLSTRGVQTLRSAGEDVREFPSRRKHCKAAEWTLSLIATAMPRGSGLESHLPCVGANYGAMRYAT